MRYVAVAANYTIETILMLGLLVAGILALSIAGIYRLAQWAELHATYHGDTADRDKARWHGLD